VVETQLVPDPVTATPRCWVSGPTAIQELTDGQATENKPSPGKATETRISSLFPAGSGGLEAFHRPLASRTAWIWGIRRESRDTSKRLCESLRFKPH
jgi:hypothetical protein